MELGSDEEDQDIGGMSDDSVKDPPYNNNMDLDDEDSSDSGHSGVCKSKTKAPRGEGDTEAEEKEHAEGEQDVVGSDTDNELPDLPYTSLCRGRGEELNVTVVPTREEGDTDGDSDDPDDPSGLSEHLPRRLLAGEASVHVVKYVDTREGSKMWNRPMSRKKKTVLLDESEEETLQEIDESALTPTLEDEVVQDEDMAAGPVPVVPPQAAGRGRAGQGRGRGRGRGRGGRG